MMIVMMMVPAMSYGADSNFRLSPTLSTPTNDSDDDDDDDSDDDDDDYNDDVANT